MRIKELLAVVDKGWVHKPKGFRVHFEKMTDSGPITDYVPDLKDALLDSDVVAWRSAWKLYQASQSDDPEFGNRKLVNIFVVDEQNRAVKYYATNRYEVFNPRPGDEKADAASPQQTH